MIIDLNRCIGCHACSMACKVKNSTGPEVHWSRVFMCEDGSYPTVRRTYIPRLCMHCEKPVCAEVCPTGATFRDGDGFVRVDEDKCIGCQACILACPYEARYLNTEKSYFGLDKPLLGGSIKGHRPMTVSKCTFCRDLVAKNKNPACVDACPTGARIFGDLDDADSAASHELDRKKTFVLHEELGLSPSVFYVTPKYFKFRDDPE